MFKSAYDQLDGVVYFPRMLEKIRMHARGELPEDYIPYLGLGFDGRCVAFLGVEYDKLRENVLEGASDQEVMGWCKDNGIERSEEEKLVWNEFMVKRGWKDTNVDPKQFEDYKKKYGYGDRPDILTYFEFFEIDEGRASR